MTRTILARLRQSITVPWPRPADIAALAVPLAMVLFLYRGAVLRGEIFYDRDINVYSHAQVVAFVKAMASGSWPVWDPWLSFGEPMWAYPTQVPYPWYWLNLLVMPWTFYTLSVLAHAAFTVVGMYALGRRFRVSRPGATLMAGAWIACGPVVSDTDMVNLYDGVAWLPWIALTCDLALQSGRVLHGVLWGACLALPVLAGSEVGLLGAAFSGVYALMHVAWRHPADARNRRVAWVTAVALVFALLFAAAQWLPTVEMIGRTARRALSHAERVKWSAHPLALLQLALPFFTRDLPLREGPLLDEYQSPFFYSTYLGIPLLGLAAASSFSRDRWRARFFALGALLALGVGIGRYFYLYDLVALLPGLKGIRYPVKAVMLTAFCVCVLAGLGLDVWRERPRDRKWMLVVAAPMLVLTLLAGLGLVVVRTFADRWAPLVLVAAGGNSYADLLRPNVERLAVAVILGAVTFVLALLRQPAARSAAGLSVALCAGVALLAAHEGAIPTTFRGLFTFRPPLLDFVRPGSRIYARKRRPGWEGPTMDPFFSTGAAPPSLSAGVAVSIAQRQYVLPPMAPLWTLSGSYEPDGKSVQPPFQQRLMLLLDATDPSPVSLRLLQMGAVDYVTSLDPTGLEALTHVATRPSVFGDPIHLYSVPQPLPRAYAVGGSVIALNERAEVKTLGWSGFDPRREVILPSGAPHLAPSGFRGTARLISLRADTVVIEAELSDPGWVVLVDTYDPNWRVTVDGAERPLLRANVAFRAVLVPPGRHTVVFTYQPWAVRWGLGLSLAGLALGAALTAREIARE